jgi:hypothetical protein
MDSIVLRPDTEVNSSPRTGAASFGWLMLFDPGGAAAAVAAKPSVAVGECRQATDCPIRHADERMSFAALRAIHESLAAVAIPFRMTSRFQIDDRSHRRRLRSVVERCAAVSYQKTFTLVTPSGVFGGARLYRLPGRVTSERQGQSCGHETTQHRTRPVIQMERLDMQ